MSKKRRQLNRKLRFCLIAEAGYTCAYCGKQGKPTKEPKTKEEKMLACLYYRIDHYVPISKGGKDIVENYVVSCGLCNSRKGAKMPFGIFLIPEMRIEKLIEVK